MMNKVQSLQHFSKRLEIRLGGIARIIERVDNRCAAADGDIPPTLDEMTQAEISEIWELSKPYLRVKQ